jgi:hypothetical protein
VGIEIASARRDPEKTTLPWHFIGISEFAW